MNTPTHMLTAAALLTESGDRRRNWAVVFGALLPDLSIFALVGWARLIEDVSHHQIWRHLYWQEPWQTLSAIFNSYVVWAVLALLAYWLGWRVLLFAAGAAVVHLSLDFPFHASDAHKHFWPLTDWRFHSPLSYWDTNHHSHYVMAAEVAVCLVAISMLWQRFSGWLVRSSLALGFFSLAAVPIFFWLTLH